MKGISIWEINFLYIKDTKQITSVIHICELNTEDSLFQTRVQVHFREVLTSDSPAISTICCHFNRQKGV
jgi:hypothetical protein